MIRRVVFENNSFDHFTYIAKKIKPIITGNLCFKPDLLVTCHVVSHVFLLTRPSRLSCLFARGVMETSQVFLLLLIGR